MNITYLVGYGPNSIQVPLMAFSTHEDAHAYLMRLGFIDQGKDWFQDIMIDGKSMDVGIALDEDGADWLREALFKGGNYYGGCGELGSITLVTTAVGTPVVGWNFD